MSWAVLGWLAQGLSLAVGVVTYLSTVLRLAWQPWIVVATFARFLLAASLGAALILGLITRDWPAVGVALCVVVARASQWRRRSAPGQNGAELRVLTANLEIGGADADRLVRALSEHRVDVLLAQEVTPEAQRRLVERGIATMLPHSFVHARPGGGGTGIWSRSALADTTLHDGFWFAVLSARLELAGGSPFVCSAHLSPPWPYPSALWAKELPLLHGLLEGQPRPGGVGDAVILGADLNATFDHPQFRALLRGELRDAAAQAGRRRLRTWPADRLRPVFGLDHILLRSATAREVRTVKLPGSDHLGVLVTVQLPES